MVAPGASIVVNVGGGGGFWPPEEPPPPQFSVDRQIRGQRRRNRRCGNCFCLGGLDSSSGQLRWRIMRLRRRVAGLVRERGQHVTEKVIHCLLYLGRYARKRQESGRYTACADSPAQALPRDVVRGQNPNDRSPSDRTDCAALPSGGAPAQPAAPQKPKPDADGLIWHPHPGYPNQERSEPDAQGRVSYKIHMTTPASQLPSRQTDAQRAAKLIYGSVIKKYGNP